MKGDGAMATDQQLATLRDEMIRGFEGIHRRLDLINGRVATQGESIATLTSKVAHTEAVTEDLRDLEQTLAAHRARCPYDMGGDLTATAPRWSNAQLAGGIGIAAGGMLVAIKLIEAIASHIWGVP